VFESVAVFGSVAPNGDTEQERVEHWATSDLTMTEITRQEMARQVFAIENDQRRLKQCGGIERAQVRSEQVRSAQAQECHTLLSLRALRLQTGISGNAAKAGIIREAIRLHLRQPSTTLNADA